MSSRPPSTVSSSSSTTTSKENQHGNEILSYGASTPRRGHSNRPFSPLDLSSVESVDIPKKRRRLGRCMEKVHEVPEAKSSRTKDRMNKLTTIIQEKLATSSRKTLSADFSKLNIASRSQHRDSDEDSSDGQHFKKKQKYVHKGQDYKQFKPKQEDGLYASVLNEPHATAFAAEVWIQEYRKDAPLAIISLFQFLIDICGYQEFNVTTIFKYEEKNILEVIDFMQKNPPNELKETGKYLMKTTSDWGIQSQNAIYQFFEYLLQYADSSKLLSDYQLLEDVIPFIFGLTLSCIKPLKHTAVVIAAKMIISFLKIEKKVKSKMDDYPSFDDVNDELADLTDYLDMLGQILVQFQEMVENNCCLNDPTLYKLKIVIVEEMCKWFSIKPFLLNSTKLFRRLLLLVKDWSKTVRLAALETCCKLVEKSQYIEYVKPLVANLVNVVGSRLYDIEYTVSSVAVQIHSRMLKSYPEDIPVLSRDAIVLFTYGKNLELAQAAAEFLMELLQKLISEEKEGSSKEFICQLIRLAQVTEEDNHAVLLIEALIHCCPYLQQWKELIDLLLSDELTPKNQATLVDIMCCAAYITITGKAKIGRTMYSNNRPKVKDARAAMEIFLEKLPMLLKKYSNEPILLEKLTDVMVAMDLTDLSLLSYKGVLASELQILRSVFVKNKRLELLENISKIFAHLSDEVCPFNVIALPIVSTLKKAIAETFSIMLTTAKDMSQKGAKVEQCVVKLSNLFAHNDMVELIDHNDLFQKWLNVKNKALTPMTKRYLISCGYFYLLWSLKKIINNDSESRDDLKDKINLLNFLREDFQKTCFIFMNSSENYDVSREAFERICNVHITFRIILEDCPVKSKSTLKKLVPPVLEAGCSIQMMDLAEKLIFDNIDEISEKERRISLGNILNLAFLNVIDYKLYRQIFKYSYSFRDVYGDIFKDAFNNMRSEASLLIVGVMLQTLIYCYNNKINQNETTPAELETATDLRQLAKEFQHYISRTLEEVKLILHLGINWATSTDSRYGFLYFLRSFTLTLPKKEKQATLESLNAKISPQHKENEFVLGFISYLNQNPKKDIGKKKTDEIDSTFETEDGEDIDNYTEITSDDLTIQDTFSDVSAA